ncbi:DUF4175 domain-containing protein [Paracoccus mutanolyticus]|uniref:DUF4175 domain-containing protein n=1 Tax=Paracoccus mutanolyticus TaxID=1499308 RepID=UPI0021D52B25|nr:DUF4175 domain-containing protein [Paracoccus mutanolyticus]
MDRPDPPQVRRAVCLTRAAMLWEAVAVAFWPLGVVLAAVVAALAFGLADVLPLSVLPWAMGLALLVLVVAAVRGWRRFRRPRPRRRGTASCGPAGAAPAALRDRAAVVAEHPPRLRLLHGGERGRPAADPARAPAPAALARPVALRLAGMVALVMALVFAPAGRFGQGIAALGATFRPAPETRPDVEAAPGWEGWAEPPAYTRRPTIYLNALPEGEALSLPEGTVLSFRIYGEGTAVAQDIGAALPGTDPAAPEFLAERDGTVEVAGRRFPVTVIPDAAPTVGPLVQPDRRADGRFVQPFSASDDNGVARGRAVIALDMSGIDRRLAGRRTRAARGHRTGPAPARDLGAPRPAGPADRRPVAPPLGEPAGHRLA